MVIIFFEKKLLCVIILYSKNYEAEEGAFMLRLAICDDMPEFLQSTRELLENWVEKPVEILIELFTDGDSLIESHTSNPFDIILLDVVMPLLNGIEVATEIRKFDKSVKLVFLTSSSEYAVESYSVKANNYLLKPIDSGKLYYCLNDFYIDIMERAKYITVKTVAAMHHIALRNIEHIEAQGKKVLFVLCDGTTVESPNPFYFYEEQLLQEDGFLKCHRSYIVNIYKISTYTQKEIRMQSGFRIPISRSYHKEFEHTYFELLFRKDGVL